MQKSNGESSSLDRKTVERNRRIHMKGLCLKLASLLPPHVCKPSKVYLVYEEVRFDINSRHQIIIFFFLLQIKEKVLKV